MSDLADELVVQVRDKVMQLIVHGDDKHREWLSAKSEEVARAIIPMVGWQQIDTCPLWQVAVVTDGENATIAQKAETDWGGYYWAIEPDDSLAWEPTYWLAAPVGEPA